MKKIAVLLSFALLLSAAGTSYASDKLLEILKSKGILTDEQFDELQKESKKEIKTSFKDGFRMESPDKEFLLQLGGRIQADFRYYNDGNKNDTFDIRRVRLEAGGTLYKYFDYKISVDFADGQAKLKDGYINFKYFPNAQIAIGQIYYPFGNDILCSSKYYEFLEIATISSALTPEYDRGIAVHGSPLGGLIYYYAGLFNGSGENGTQNSDDFDYAARVVLNPTVGREGPFQAWIGASYGYGQQNGVNSNDIRLQTESRSGNNYFVAAIPTSRGFERERMGVEATLLYGPAMLKGELLKTNYDFEKKADVEGGYVATSWFLTGEQRSVKNGNTIRQKVKKPFDIDKGHWGAWELAARYSWFEVDDKFFQTNGLYSGWTAVSSTSYANEGDAWTAGINWYPNSMTRLMIDWVHSEASNDLPGGTSNIFTHDGGNVTDVEDALLVRAQIEF
ncbi:MAG: OprO/OprP family phosphate-selective porin [Nitrospirota bacterium]|nr:OprO/OprP family phosphate-selective porin [Nitrospirota bacterium]